MNEPTAIPPSFTGRHGNAFYIEGRPSKEVVEWCERKFLVRFPDLATRNYCLGLGPRPVGLIDGLPDDPQEATAATP